MKLVSPKSSILENPITVSWKLKENNLLVDFQIAAPVFHEKKIFSQGEYPYQFDVVEVFLVVDDYEDDKNLIYYEFEVTPNNQIYHLRLDMVDGVRKPNDTINLEAEVKVKRESDSWSAQFIISLDKLGWEGDIKKLKGNFYGIIGPLQEKTYWSQFLGPQEVPNFHTPSSFQQLFPED